MSASIPTPEPEKFRDYHNLKDRFVKHPDGVTALNVCPRCKHDRVQVEVMQWLQTDGARGAYNGADALVSGDCPDCGLHIEAGVTEDALMAYREFFVATNKRLAFALADQDAANTESEIEHFKALLEHDIILPEDFK